MASHSRLDGDVPLLSALPPLQRLAMSSFNMKRFGFTKTQLTIFTVLSGKGSLTMTQIAEYISSSNAQATRAVAALVDAGYAARFIEDDNRAKVHIRLTDAGQAFLDACVADFRASLERRLESCLSTGELRELEQALGTVSRLAGKVE